MAPRAILRKNHSGLSYPARKLAQALGTITLQVELSAKGYTLLNSVQQANPTNYAE